VTTDKALSAETMPSFYECSVCGATIDNSKLFIRCAEPACPEKSGKSLLDMLEEISFPASQEPQP
jgi:hypothetical protein